MKVLTRNPRCHVRIISLEYGEISADLLRPVLRRVSTHRRMGNAAGSFQLLLLPRRVNTAGLPTIGVMFSALWIMWKSLSR